MLLKVGDTVRLNPDFLEIWFNEGNTSFKKKDVCNKKFSVTKIEYLENNEFRIYFKHNKEKLHNLNILSNGEFNKTNEYKGIQVFIPIIGLNYKYRLYPTEKQIEYLDLWLEISRQLYNLFLEPHSYKRKQYHYGLKGFGPTHTDQGKDFTAAKPEMPRELRETIGLFPDSNYRLLLRRIHKNLDEWKGKNKKGFLHFKKYGNYNSVVIQYNTQTNKSGTITGMHGVIYRNKILYISSKKNKNILNIKVNEHRPLLTDKIKMVTIKKECNKWYVIFAIEYEKESINPNEELSQKTIGIDPGCTNLVTCYDGEEFLEIENKKFRKQEQAKMARLQRKLSRQERGSNNWKITKESISKLHKKIANKRGDLNHKISAELSYNNVGIENTNTIGILRGGLKNVRKSASDAGWADLKNKLEYKCKIKGTYFIEVNPRNTSQTCPKCGIVVRKELKEDHHNCKECGYKTTRDRAAAEIMRQRAIEKIKQMVN